MTRREAGCVLAILFFPITLVIIIIVLLIKILQKIGKTKAVDAQQEDSLDVEVWQSNEFDKQEEIVDFSKTHSTYTAKESLLTDCEKEYFFAIKKIVGENYVVQPQVNLASVVCKEDHGRYRNELFRNIDFGVFDANYSLKVLIEINDQSHEAYERRKRDLKVREICNKAGIPLVTFWTKYGVNLIYMKKVLSRYIYID